jgi:peroxiredoxin
MRIHRLIVASVLALAPVLVAFADEDKDKVEVGSKAPALAPKKVVQGEMPDLNTEKGCVIVEFWATWCGPCNRAIPHMNRLYKELKDRGLQVIAVSDEKEKTVTDFLKKKDQGMTYPVASDEDGETDEKWLRASGQAGIPCAFIVGRGGKVLWIGNPLSDQFEPTVRKALTGRFDPDGRESMEPAIKAARKCAEVRNWSEAYKHYGDAIDMDAALALDVTQERFKATLLKQKDPKAAYAWLTETAKKKYGGDPEAVVELVTMVVKDPEVQPRDLDAAAAMAEDMGSKGGHRSMEVKALVAFAKGDLTSAVDLQTDAWMTAEPVDKATAKRTLDEYRAAAKRSQTKAASGG